jgi:hypothetical protein
MFAWNDKYRFIFSDLGASDKVGVNDVGIGVFKKKPYIGLTKEILQNSTDAPDPSLPSGTPVRVRFELTYVDRDDIPDVDKLNSVIHKCYEYYPNGDDGVKLKTIQDAADQYLAQPGKVPVLKISDYNTTGLCGVQAEKGSKWSGLVRERSATNKTGGSSGSFGVGKFAPFTFSSLRTVFYSTKTVKGETAFQGKALLTTFKEDGVLKHNIGLLADTTSKNFDAVLTTDDIAPVFRRDEVGTDIFVLGFEKDRDWMEQSAISVIEYFFYSIFKGNLEVTVAEGDKAITITQSNLGEMIAFFEKYCAKHMKDDVTFQYTAPVYWKLLCGSHKVIRERFTYNRKDMGEYELYLFTGDDVAEKKVLEMREAGMKIREDTAFRIPMNFTGIFIATGAGAKSLEPEDNISSFLRKCENQAHDDWSADEYREKRDMAKSIINKIHSIILNAAKKEMPDFGKDSVDAFGLSEFLQTEESDDDKKEEEAFADFRPLSFEIKSVKTGKHRRQADISIKKNGGSKRKKPEEKKPPKKEADDQNPKKKRNNQHGNGTGKASEVFISKVKTPFNSATGEYRISFTADETAEDLMLAIRLGGDDDNLARAEISKATENGKRLPIKNGMINVGSVAKGDKKMIDIKLSEVGRKTLEVRAYAKS